MAKTEHFVIGRTISNQQRCNQWQQQSASCWLSRRKCIALNSEDVAAALALAQSVFRRKWRTGKAVPNKTTHHTQGKTRPTSQTISSDSQVNVWTFTAKREIGVKGSLSLALPEIYLYACRSYELPVFSVADTTRKSRVWMKRFRESTSEQHERIDCRLVVIFVVDYRSSSASMHHFRPSQHLGICCCPLFRVLLFFYCNFSSSVHWLFVHSILRSSLWSFFGSTRSWTSKKQNKSKTKKDEEEAKQRQSLTCILIVDVTVSLGVDPCLVCIDQSTGSWL